MLSLSCFSFVPFGDFFIFSSFSLSFYHRCASCRWSAWERIDQAERAAGAAAGKPREKIVSVHAMLDVANQEQP
jgi:hypothetical protein